MPLILGYNRMPTKPQGVAACLYVRGDMVAALWSIECGKISI